MKAYQLFRFAIAVIFCISSVPSILFGQSRAELKATLFNDVEKLMAKVQAEQGNVLAPSNFKNAMNRYDQALRDFNEGKRLRDIQDKLEDVKRYFSTCLKTAETGHLAFSSTLKAREDALHANAPEYAQRLYEDAENEFISAAKKLERGVERDDIKGVKNLVPKIDQLYRKAELSAIKVSIIGTVKNLVREAKEIKADEVTPITYAKALQLLNESEAILNSDRRSESSAKQKAEAAEIEAKHAIYLTKEIQRLKKDNKEWEGFILEREALIEEVAQVLGFEATFDEGMDKPLKTIYRISNILQSEKKELVAEVQQKEQEITALRTELNTYREKEQGLQAELQEKQYRLEQKRKREELISSIENMFDPSEASLLRKGDDLILRLIGLTFPSGRATIQPDYFSLLAKVQRAIRKLPTGAITIEGHTDSVGDDRYNESLSYERAMAVKSYIVANMGLDESRITALGYGETRPIASNETKGGRAQNRRIDIVLSINEEPL